MAQKKAPSNVEVKSSLSERQAAKLLRTQCDKGQTLLNNRPITSSAEQTWETVTREILIRAFGSESPNVSSVMDVGRWDFAFGGGNEHEWEQKRAENMQTRLEIIEGLIELLESTAELDSGPQTGTPFGVDRQHHLSNKIFLVHGRNEAAIHETARFLERLGVEVTVLREQPNHGRTIIEKFVDYSEVGFAVVLLTADDRGGPATAPYEDQVARARQNVVLELGFFLGKLGRKRVCALYENGVEIPSDYNGVLFVPLDSGGAWRLSLARELKAAGLQIDMNLAV